MGQQKGIPGVHAKGVQSLELLKFREQFFRLDVWPFFALYVAIACKAVLHAGRFEW